MEGFFAKQKYKPQFKIDIRVLLLSKHYEISPWSKVSQIDIADDFYDAYRICLFTGTNRIYSIPGFVNGLFACELYLKVLVGNKAKALKGKDGHNLLVLYSLLDGKEKEALDLIDNDSGLGLECLLSKIGNGFIAWRYLYEDGNDGFGEGYPFHYTEALLKAYLPVLKTMAHDRPKSTI